MAKNPYQGDDVDPFSGARDEEGGIKQEKPKAEPKKDRVVSKKELEESGLSLRDFLNKERGLKRRKDKSEEKGPSDTDLDRMVKKFEGHMGKSEREKELGVFGAKGKNPRPANPPKFKKGGSVSSASKRADGIAMKGKTRGRMV